MILLPEMRQRRQARKGGGVGCAVRAVGCRQVEAEGRDEHAGKRSETVVRCGCKLHVMNASSRVKRLSWPARGREDAVEAEVEEEEEERRPPLDEVGRVAAVRRGHGGDDEVRTCTRREAARHGDDDDGRAEHRAEVEEEEELGRGVAVRRTLRALFWFWLVSPPKGSGRSRTT